MIENFGKNVARLRKEHGYSQEQLAKEIEVNRQTISNIERGARYPTFETLEKIAKLFKATPTQLFGTPKEIAVSDTPIILDRIDEYNSKIQAILQIPDIVETYGEEIRTLAEQVTTINSVVFDLLYVHNDDDTLATTDEGILVRSNLPEEINAIANDARVINYFFRKPIITDEDGMPYHDKNGKEIFEKSMYEKLPVETIKEIASTINYIKKNKDNV
ncbi:TPA: helix-turn-helix transcriptional regulator [Enterococcus faecalis]|uniref:helix-turn-helix transcriptional regulator n=1 Tax=Enterococcus faecalis TaxID=1351 RepID=UPI000CF6F1EC|nr:helix-turn-helix transcriptional regulator [Enterococcus faecalis]PQC14818.1 transcriptional regulator [Enterococcus faecalis]HAP3762123.1 helix-turn-helix transcriptional regulator [Enterococcus faecalis]